MSTRTKEWALTREAFDRLLALFDTDREAAGEKYELLRRKLVEFFEAHGCQSPEENADETLDRVARRISEGEEVNSVYGYCYGVARMRLFEVARERAKEPAELDPFVPVLRAAESEGEEEERRREAQERRLDCLRRCLRELPDQTRELVVEYYREEKKAKIERRKEMARRLGVPLNTLRVRMHRIRIGLDACVSRCVGQTSRD